MDIKKSISSINENLSTYNSDKLNIHFQTTLQECLRLRESKKYIPPSCAIHFGKTYGYTDNDNPWIGAPHKLRGSTNHHKLQRRLTNTKI